MFLTLFLSNDFIKTPEADEVFIDSLHIGAKTKNMIDLRYFKDADSYVEIKFFTKKKKQWQQQNTYSFKKDTILSCNPTIEDFNNDGFLDFSYVSDRAARGSNEVRRLFIYNPKKDVLTSMKNAENYPNLQYNKKLNCLTSQMFHGGSTTVFLKIEKDSLHMFASVDNSDEQVISTFDKNGKETVISRKPLPVEDIYYRYENYSPAE